MSASAADVGRKVICADGWRVTMHVEVRRGPSQGPDSERQGSNNRMSAAMFSGSPHSTRATTPDRTERQVTSEAADEATDEATVNAKVGAVSKKPAREPECCEPRARGCCVGASRGRWIKPAVRTKDHEQG